MNNDKIQEDLKKDFEARAKRIAINKMILKDVMAVRDELNELFEMFTKNYKKDLRIAKKLADKEFMSETNGERYNRELGIKDLEDKIKKAEKQRIDFLKEEIHLIKLRLDSEYKRHFKNKSRHYAEAIIKGKREDGIKLKNKVGSKLKKRTKLEANKNRHKLKLTPDFAKPKGL